MPEDATLAALAKALAHPARIRILCLVQATPGCIGEEIVEALGLAQSTVSEHLRILFVSMGETMDEPAAGGPSTGRPLPGIKASSPLP